MISLQLTATKANVNIEEGTVIITGVEVDEIISEIPNKELLDAMEYSDVFDYVMQTEKDKKEENEQRQ